MKLLQFITICVLLVLGLLNPINSLDAIITFLTFGLFLSFFLLIYLKQYKSDVLLKRGLCFIFFVTLTIALLTLFKQKPQLLNLAIASIALGILLCYLFAKRLLKYPYILLYILILFFLLTAYVNSNNLRNLIKQEPQAESYFTDHLSFLRVYYLVDQGYDYYSAHVKAHIEDGRSDTIPQRSWYWRLPTYAYFWNFFPGTTGVSIYVAFLSLSILMLIFAYKIAKFFLPTNLAILSPYLVFPYFHFAARDLAFLEMEWWGVNLLIIGIYFILKNNYFISLTSLSLAVFLKETFMIHVVTIGLLSFLNKSKKVFYMTILISVLLGFYLLLHFLNVNTYTNQGLAALAPTDHPVGFFLLQQTLSYGSWEYLFFRLKPFYILLLVSLTYTVFLLIRKKLNFALSILTIPIFVFALALIKIGSPPFDDYWGAAYVPLMLITTPIVLLKSL